jgi:hypothetical protein
MSTAINFPPSEATQNPFDLTPEQKADFKDRQRTKEFQFLFQFEMVDESHKKTLLAEMRAMMKNKILFVLTRSGELLEVFGDEKTPEEVIRTTTGRVQIWLEANPDLYKSVIANEAIRVDVAKSRKVKYEELATS